MSLTENPEGSYAEEALQKYGYQQEFRRELKRFASFAIGFSFISITTGIFTTYGFVLINSGPWASGRGHWLLLVNYLFRWFLLHWHLGYRLQAIRINGYHVLLIPKLGGSLAGYPLSS